MTPLRQGTATDVEIGPFIDSTDFVSLMTSLTLSQADCLLMKNGGAASAKNDATAATHRGGAHFSVPLNATDTGTVGRLRLIINEGGAVPMWRDFFVLPAQVYDSLMAGTDKLQVHADEITNALITTAALADGAITAAKLADALITAAKLADNAITNAKLADNAIGASKLADGALTANKIADNAITAAKIAPNAIDADSLAADAGTEIRTGLALESTVNAVGSSVSAVGTLVSAIKAKTDGLNFTGADVKATLDGETVTVGDKTGYKLAADGLDTISTTAPTGVASNFREMVVAVWRLFFKKVTETADDRKTYGDDGTTVLTTQTLQDNGTTQTQGPAS